MREENKEKKLKIIIGILILLIILGSSYYEKRINDKNSCISNCILEQDICVSYMSEFTQAGTEYILYWDYEDCFSELEFCISWCKR